MDCIFCNIAAKKVPADIVLETKDVVVFKDIHPKAPVHLLLIPTMHIPSVNELTPQNAAHAAALLLAVPQAAKQAGVADGYKLAVNVGAKGGQVVGHLHLHLLGWPDTEGNGHEKEVLTV